MRYQSLSKGIVTSRAKINIGLTIGAKVLFYYKEVGCKVFGPR